MEKAVPRARMFAFGSILRTKPWPADVDVLVVYESAGDAQHVRTVLEPLYNELPLHVLFLTSSEESQLQFVANAKCLPLN